MSNAYVIDKAHKRVFEVWAGEITQQELREHAYRHATDPNLPHPFDILVDIEEASFEDAIDKEFLKEITDLYREYANVWASARMAVIPGENFRRSVIYAHLAAARGVRAIVFNTLSVACTWFGIPYSEAQEGLNEARVAIAKSEEFPPP